jgi:hypothetical protein
MKMSRVLFSSQAGIPDGVIYALSFTTSAAQEIIRFMEFGTYRGCCERIFTNKSNNTVYYNVMTEDDVLLCADNNCRRHKGTDNAVLGEAFSSLLRTIPQYDISMSRGFFSVAVDGRCCVQRIFGMEHAEFEAAVVEAGKQMPTAILLNDIPPELCIEKQFELLNCISTTAVCRYDNRSKHLNVSFRRLHESVRHAMIVDMPPCIIAQRVKDTAIPTRTTRKRRKCMTEATAHADADADADADEISQVVSSFHFLFSIEIVLLCSFPLLLEFIRSFTFFLVCLRSFSFILVHSRSFPFVYIRSRSVSFIRAHSRSFPFYFVHFRFLFYFLVFLRLFLVLSHSISFYLVY